MRYLARGGAGAGRGSIGAVSAASSLAFLPAACASCARRARVPGVAVGCFAGGESLVACDGVTNAEHPLPVDETTLFQIASLTKPFTATALVRLAREGKLDLEAPVRRVLPEFRLPRAEWTDRVRVVDLLTHRNGWAGDRFFIRAPRERSLAGPRRGVLRQRAARRARRRLVLRQRRLQRRGARDRGGERRALPRGAAPPRARRPSAWTTPSSAPTRW